MTTSSRGSRRGRKLPKIPANPKHGPLWLPAQLNEFLDRTGLSLAAFSRYLGRNYGTVKYWRSGHTPIPLYVKLFAECYEERLRFQVGFMVLRAVMAGAEIKPAALAAGLRVPEALVSDVCEKLAKEGLLE